MKKHSRLYLEEKKAALKNKLATEEYYRQYIQDWYFWFRELKNQGIEVSIESIYSPDIFTANLKILFEKSAELQQNLGIYLNPHEGRDFFEEVQQKFPGILELRYLPRLPNRIPCEEDPDDALKIILPETVINETVLILFPAYAGVLSSHLDTIISNAASIFELPVDICIVNRDLSLIIYRSLEDEWLWQLPGIP